MVLNHCESIDSNDCAMEVKNSRTQGTHRAPFSSALMLVDFNRTVMWTLHANKEFFAYSIRIFNIQGNCERMHIVIEIVVILWRTSKNVDFQRLFWKGRFSIYLRRDKYGRSFIMKFPESSLYFSKCWFSIFSSRGDFWNMSHLGVILSWSNFVGCFLTVSKHLWVHQSEPDSENYHT